MKWSIVVFLWFASAAAKSHINIQNGGYENLVVAIGNDIPDTNCASLLENLKVLLSNASDVLYRATDRKFYFRSIDVVLPRDWSIDKCGGVDVNKATYQTLGTADIRISGPHPIHGDQPWTLQVGGCGVMGEYISIGEDFLLNLNKTNHVNGRLVVKEWAKYRYGVFDEAGYPGDPFYPASREEDFDPEVPTTCSDRPLVGKMTESPVDGTVRYFEVDQEETGPVTTSLLALPSLDNVTLFCDASSHDKLAPTKQNAICNWQSAWEVIQLSSDFTTLGGNYPHLATLPDYVMGDTQPTFKFVRSEGQRMVFLIDRSATMIQFDRLTFVRRAMLEFFKAVPEGTRVGIVMYAEAADPVLSMTVVTNGNRNSFEDELDRSTSIVDKRDLLDAVNKGLQMVQGETEGTDIIIVTSDKNRPENLETIQNTLIRSKVRVSVVNYPQNTYHGFKDMVSRTGGHIFYVNERAGNEQGQIGNMIQLMDAFYSIIDGKLASGIKVYERMDVESIIQAHAEHDVMGEFILDNSLGRTTFTVYYYYGQTGLYDARRIRLTSPSGTVYTNIETSMGTKVVRINNPQAGRWSYSFTSTAPYPQVTVVQVRGQPATEAISVRSWTSWDAQQITDPVDRPLILYGEVRKGSSPVIGAKVVATVEFLGRSGEEREMGAIEVTHLTDDGTGGPDIQQGDGIYSTYFTQFATIPGQYKVTLSVTDVPEVTSVLRPIDSFYLQSNNSRDGGEVITPHCCGSHLPPYIPTESVSDLQRIVSGPTFTVTSPPSLGSDLFPPSRVFDLRSDIQKSGRVDHFNLLWIAPGGDFNFGRATAYDIRYSRSKQSLIDNISTTDAIKRIPEPQYAGLLEQLQVDVVKEGLQHGQTYYFAIRSGDGTHWSKLSNIARVYIPPVPTTTTTSTQSPFIAQGSHDGSRSASSQVKDKVMNLSFLEIGGIVAGIVLFLLILAGFIAYYTVNSSKNRKLPEQRKEITILPPVNKNEILRKQPDGSDYRQNYITDDIKKTDSLLNQSVTSIGLYGVDGHVSPVQSWPASVLLTEHERRKSYTSLQNGQVSRCTEPSQRGYYPDNMSVHSYHNPQYMLGPPHTSDYRLQHLPPLPGPKPKNLIGLDDKSHDSYPVHGPETTSLRGSSNPSDSGLSLSSDNLQRPKDSEDKPKKIPPPVFPKPNMALLQTPRLRDSVNSSEYDRRVRNITQV